MSSNSVAIADHRATMIYTPFAQSEKLSAINKGIA